MFSFGMCLLSGIIITVIFLVMYSVNSKFYIYAFSGFCYIAVLSVYSLSFNKVEVIETIPVISVIEQEGVWDTYSISFGHDLKEPVIEKIKVYGLYDILYKNDERLVLPYPEDKN